MLGVRSLESGSENNAVDKFNFENLSVYQKALNFVNVVYYVTAKYPNDERFALIDQFRRAAISVALNIAEGYGLSKPGFRRYLNIAKGSIRESVAIITLSKSRGYMDCKTEAKLRQYCIEIAKMLSGLISKL